MKKDVMEKWVAALRSGEYKQGRGWLISKENEYCCLGVLCEISPTDLNQNYNNLFPNGSTLRWAGLKTNDGRLPKIYKTKKEPSNLLTDLNDRGLSFKQIANIIEHNYKEL